MLSAFLKRTIDIVLALVGLVVLSPLMALIAIAIRIVDGGPVLFLQERIGIRFQPFMMFKFRTMVPNGGGAGASGTVADGRRVTRLGRFLRHTKLDELPQLLNVLEGQMSLVGPRPELRDYVRQFRTDYQEILSVRPGITDLASILYRDEAALLARSEDPERVYVERILPHKIRLAHEYVRRRSTPYDLWLLASTLVCLVYPKPAIDRLFERLGRHHRTVSWIVQGALALAAHFLAVDLRFEGRVPANDAAVLRETLPILIGMRLVAFLAFGLHRSLWRYVGMRDLHRIGAAVAVSSLAFWVTLTHVLHVSSYPRSVVILDALLCVLLLGGIRFGRRVQSGLRKEFPLARRVLMIGGGDAGARMIEQLAREPGYDVVGLVDLDRRRKGLTIHGVPILGTVDQLATIVAEREPDAIVVESALPAEARREIARVGARHETPVHTLPGFRDLLAARPGQAPAAAGEAENLLAREPVVEARTAHPDRCAGRRILVTGAGGAIGAEICRRAADSGAARVVLFERHEASLERIARELRRTHPGLELFARLGDVTDGARVNEVLEETHPDVVFHAGACHRAALVEENPSEAYKTNVLGTQIVAGAARRHRVELFVLLSAEPAVEPVGALGLSLRGAELAVQAMAGNGLGRFVVVRFGEVIENSGGVVALLREQIEAGGPLTVSHPEATRRFVTAAETVELLLEVAVLAQDGGVYVLEIGKPVRVVDLAHALLRRHGYAEGRDLELVFTGLQAGERLSAKLFNDHETVWKTSHPHILMAVNGAGTVPARERLRELMSAIERRIRSGGTPAEIGQTFARARTLAG